jgi:hypothetical protein
MIGLCTVTLGQTCDDGSLQAKYNNTKQPFFTFLTSRKDPNTSKTSINAAALVRGLGIGGGVSLPLSTSASGLGEVGLLAFNENILSDWTDIAIEQQQQLTVAKMLELARKDGILTHETTWGDSGAGGKRIINCLCVFRGGVK